MKVSSNDTTALKERLHDNAEREYWSGWEEDFAPRVVRKPSEWAAERRIIAAGTGVVAGHDMRYDHALMPHLVEIMDCAVDPTVKEIVMWFGIRDGKTMGVCMNLLGWIVEDDPGNICSVHPIDDDAARFSEGDIEPTLLVNEWGKLFVERKSRDAGRTVSFKKFRGGWVRIFSSGSASKFRGTSVRLMCLHELDALDPEAIFKAMGRSTGFPDAIVVKESTGTIAAEIDDKTGKKIYRSRIEEAYDRGDQRKWFCPCQGCGHLQLIEYEQIKYPPGEPQRAYYECNTCAKRHTPKEWKRMVSRGVWHPTAGLDSAQVNDIANTHHLARAIAPEVRSYWRNGFNSLLPHHSSFRSKLHEFVAQGEAAQSSVESLKIWTQEVKAELWNPQSEGEAPPAWKPLFDRRESYGLIVPQGGLFLTAFTDLQKHRMEIGWRAFGRNEESWGMDHKVIAGYVGDMSTWVELCRELCRSWRHATGAEIKLGQGLIDGGKWPDMAYRFFQLLAAFDEPQHPLHSEARKELGSIGSTAVNWIRAHVRASKGYGQHGHPIVARKMSTVGKVLKGHAIGTWEAKDRIYERLRMKGGDEISQEQNAHALSNGAVMDLARNTATINAAPTSEPEARQEGFMHFNRQYREEFFQGLTKEKVTIVFEGGQEIRKYIDKVSGNEPLDIEVGCLAAHRLYPRDYDQIEQGLQEAAQPVSAPMRPPEPQRQAGGRSWAVAGMKW